MVGRAREEEEEEGDIRAVFAAAAGDMALGHSTL